ncbi:hypothetical protein ASPZODRAFT_1133523 [Penicilliopsis zonata CBS 506.65]|uniref:HNH nuclease domain-containing protein n=1 Tax=Penicilliopsis zonata CBS 506.65 TaxID=1073090 RepID=A0A1L9SSP2_9EURO|nr:hypothetical protein ASPZODRAFT_1133523 [Penicilliopsis zonata CBS 506.65]OJJ50228.1 hypothetical protein ASPZODRAFT_1133523 [Penicilliopsis zonata CBS 506.65]
MWLPTSGIGSKFRTSRSGSGSAQSSPGKNPSAPQTPKAGASTSATRMESSPSMPARKKRKIDTSDLSSSPRRGEDAGSDCHARDRVCILTKATQPLEAAHIFPSHLCNNSSDSQLSFIMLLGIFWSGETVDKWTRHNEAVLKSVANRLLLCPSCHSYWDRGLFGLLPVSVAPDTKSITVKFYWLGGDKDLPATGSTELLGGDDNFILPPIAMPSDLREGGHRQINTSKLPDVPPNLALFDNETENIISSGETITITTPDPDSLPLPSEDLLSLQWTLHRLAALCAAAGWQPSDEDDDENNNDSASDQEAFIQTPLSEELQDVSRMTEGKMVYMEERLGVRGENSNMSGSTN